MLDAYEMLGRATTEQEIDAAVSVAQKEVAGLPLHAQLEESTHFQVAVSDRRKVLKRGLENERRHTQGGGALAWLFAGGGLTLVAGIVWAVL